MSAMDLIVGLGSLISGVKTIYDGVKSVDEAAGLGLFDKNKVRTASIPSSGDPVTTFHDVGSNVKHRIKIIGEQVKKGLGDARVREFATKVLSSRCSTCPKCKTKNSFSQVNYIKPGTVRGKLGDPFWTCGKCKGENNIATLKWCYSEKDWEAEAAAIFNAVRQNVRYTRDMDKIDTYQHPKRTLDWNAGDCDDYTILLAVLYRSVGYPVKARVMETRDAEGKPAGTWTHILPIIGTPPGGPTKWWVAADASVNQALGWYPPKGMIVKTKDFDL